MAAAGRIGFCIDEACGRQIAAILRNLRAPGGPDIHDAREIGLGGVADDILMIELGKRGFTALVTRDSRILNASIRRDAWLQSGLTLFVLDGKWGSLTLFEQARRMIWWWPSWIAASAEGPQGAAWRVAPDPPKIARIFSELHTPSTDAQ
jgi:hypothetical protein